MILSTASMERRKMRIAICCHSGHSHSQGQAVIPLACHRAPPELLETKRRCLFSKLHRKFLGWNE